MISTCGNSCWRVKIRFRFHCPFQDNCFQFTYSHEKVHTLLYEHIIKTINIHTFLTLIFVEFYFLPSQRPISSARWKESKVWVEWMTWIKCCGVSSANSGCAIEVGEADDLSSFVLVSVGCCWQHVKEAGRTVDEYGLNDAFVKSQQEVGSTSECSEFAGGGESLLAAFMDVSGVFFKA